MSPCGPQHLYQRRRLDILRHREESLTRHQLCLWSMAVIYHTGAASQRVGHDCFRTANILNYAHKSPSNARHTTVFTWPTKSLPLTDGSSCALLCPSVVILRFTSEAHVMSGVRFSLEYSLDKAKALACEKANVQIRRVRNVHVGWVVS